MPHLIEHLFQQIFAKKSYNFLHSELGAICYTNPKNLYLKLFKH